MIMTIPAGTVIIQEGEVNMDMYKIIGGHAELYSGYGTDREAILGILSKGKYFGELGLLAEKPSIYTVVAYDELYLLRITMYNIEDYIQKNFHDIYEIMKGMAEATYNLKYSMDLFIDDVANGKVKQEDIRKYNQNLAKQLAKYNLNRTGSKMNFKF